MRRILLFLLVFTTYLLNSCCPCSKQQKTRVEFDSIEVSEMPGMYIPKKGISYLVIYPNHRVKKYFNKYVSKDCDRDSIVPLSSSEQLKISTLTKELFVTRQKKDITTKMKNPSYWTDAASLIVVIYNKPLSTTYNYYFGYEGIKYSDEFMNLLKYLE